MQPGFVRSAVVLGVLAFVGPFAIDMYLPALPTIAEDLDSSIAGAQMTFTAFFLAFGAAQLLYGPVADWKGRKLPIYFGLGIFVLGSLGCALAPSIGWLTFGRFVQALGASAVMVIPRAIVRDLHTGNEATRLMALIMLVISASPMLAPLAGSLIIEFADWRWIFVALTAIAAVSLALTVFQLPETLPEERRVPIQPRVLLVGTKRLLTNPNFVGLTFIGGFGMASFFIFLASASFVYTGQYGMTPIQFSLAFALNAIGFFGASQLAPNAGERFGMPAMVYAATSGFAFFACSLFLLTLSGFDSIVVLIGFLFMGNFCLGFVIAPVMVMALDDHGDIAGLASSLGGTIQMVTGGIMILLSGPFFDGTSLPMVGNDRYLRRHRLWAGDSDATGKTELAPGGIAL
jgi:DHA1 family bicyclomycin/chloramphenicol resistance-like MFS transporter